jgi:hypothetical protein
MRDGAAFVDPAEVRPLADAAGALISDFTRGAPSSPSSSCTSSGTESCCWPTVRSDRDFLTALLKETRV